MRGAHGLAPECMRQHECRVCGRAEKVTHGGKGHSWSVQPCACRKCGPIQCESKGGGHDFQGRHYHWSLDEAQPVFLCEREDVVADICVVGSVSASEGTFLWAWANAAIPPHARRGLERVREFGERNTLKLLSTPEWPLVHVSMNLCTARAAGTNLSPLAGRGWRAASAASRVRGTLNELRVQTG